MDFEEFYKLYWNEAKTGFYTNRFIAFTIGAFGLLFLGILLFTDWVKVHSIGIFYQMGLYFFASFLVLSSIYSWFNQIPESFKIKSTYYESTKAEIEETVLSFANEFMYEVSKKGDNVYILRKGLNKFIINLMVEEGFLHINARNNRLGLFDFGQEKKLKNRFNVFLELKLKKKSKGK